MKMILQALERRQRELESQINLAQAEINRNQWFLSEVSEALKEALQAAPKQEKVG